jgi:hypothetical protein
MLLLLLLSSSSSLSSSLLSVLPRNDPHLQNSDGKAFFKMCAVPSTNVFSNDLIVIGIFIGLFNDALGPV